MTVRVRFDGDVLVPAEKLQLPKGQLLDAELHPVNPTTGSPRGLLAYIRTLPNLPKELQDEFESGIANGQAPARFEGPFDHNGDD